MMSKELFICMISDILEEINDTNYEIIVVLYSGLLINYGIKEPRIFIKDLLEVSYEIKINNEEIK